MDEGLQTQGVSRLKWWRDVLLSGLITGGLMGYWGHYQHQQGFRLGVDTTLCAWRVGVETKGKVLPRSLSECRAHGSPGGYNDKS